MLYKCRKIKVNFFSSLTAHMSEECPEDIHRISRYPMDVLWTSFGHFVLLGFKLYHPDHTSATRSTSV